LILQPLSVTAIKKGIGNNRAGSLQNQGRFFSILIHHKGNSFGIASKPAQKPVGKLTLFQGISQVLSHRKTA
jgi:hypothetical protein